MWLTTAVNSEAIITVPLSKAFNPWLLQWDCPVIAKVHGAFLWWCGVKVEGTNSTSSGRVVVIFFGGEFCMATIWRLKTWRCCKQFFGIHHIQCPYCLTDFTEIGFSGTAISAVNSERESDSLQGAGLHFFGSKSNSSQSKTLSLSLQALSLICLMNEWTNEWMNELIN